FRKKSSSRGPTALTSHRTSATCSTASKTCLARELSRSYPALDVRLTGEAATDLIFAILDDFQPTALEERADFIRAFFSTNDARDRASASLGSRFDATPLEVSDENWAARSQQNLVPITVGRITVAPPWIEPGFNHGSWGPTPTHSHSPASRLARAA